LIFKIKCDKIKEKLKREHIKIFIYEEIYMLNKIFFIIGFTSWSFILVNHLVKLINKNVERTIIEILKRKEYEKLFLG
jgi:hypothetical protein